MEISNLMIHKYWRAIASCASGEFILKSTKANDGSIILGRAIFVSAWLTCLIIIARLVAKQNISIIQFIREFYEIANWSAGFLGAVYIALYARFSSQWSYMAGLYNQIKQAEFSMICAKDEDDNAKKILAQWKAAYIEDAYYLHLYGKKSVAIVIYHWGKDKLVEKVFVESSINGTGLWEKIRSVAVATVANSR